MVLTMMLPMVLVLTLMLSRVVVLPLVLPRELVLAGLQHSGEEGEGGGGGGEAHHRHQQGEEGQPTCRLHAGSLGSASGASQTPSFHMEKHQLLPPLNPPPPVTFALPVSVSVSVATYRFSRENSQLVFF